MAPLIDVIAVRPVGPQCLLLTFSDGLKAKVELADRIAWTGVFAALRTDAELFAAASVDPERGVVTWPNGADLDSDQLHAWAKGLPAPEWASAA